MNSDIGTGTDWIGRLANHMVSFECVCDVPAVREAPAHREGWIVTAFVVSVRGYWFLFTAGHIFDQIESDFANGVRFGQWRLFDHWGSDHIHEEPLPVDFNRSQWKVYYDDTSGLDYAIHTVSLQVGGYLSKNNVRPFPEVQWDVGVKDEYDSYCLMGFPKQTYMIEGSNASGEAVYRELHSMIVDRVDVPPSHTVREIPCFYGIIPGGVSAFTSGRLTDIGGMSGGPIIGLRGAKYRLIAMQSGVLNRAGNIIGVGMQHFLTELTREIDSRAAGSTDQFLR